MFASFAHVVQQRSLELRAIRFEDKTRVMTKETHFVPRQDAFHDFGTDINHSSSLVAFVTLFSLRSIEHVYNLIMYNYKFKRSSSWRVACA